MEVYEVMKKNQYGQYLKDVMDGKYQEHSVLIRKREQDT